MRYVAIVVGVQQQAIAVDHKGGTVHRRAYHAVDGPILPHAVKPAYLAVRIRQQRYRDAVLITEIRMRQALVQTHASHRGAQPGKLALTFGKRNGLLLARGHRIARIEMQHHEFVPQHLAKIEHVHFRVWQAEHRSGLASTQWSVVGGCHACGLGRVPELFHVIPLRADYLFLDRRHSGEQQVAAPQQAGTGTEDYDSPSGAGSGDRP